MEIRPHGALSSAEVRRGEAERAGIQPAFSGELARSDAWALVAQAGLRTADHLLEIKVLLTFAVGVRVRL